MRWLECNVKYKQAMEILSFHQHLTTCTLKKPLSVENWQRYQIFQIRTWLQIDPQDDLTLLVVQH